MTKLFCKSCGCNFIVSELKIRMSDNDWFYGPDCGSGHRDVHDPVGARIVFIKADGD